MTCKTLATWERFGTDYDDMRDPTAAAEHLFRWQMREAQLANKVRMKDGRANIYGIRQESDTTMVILTKWWNDQYSRNQWRTPVEWRLTYLGLVVVTLNCRRNQAGFSIRGMKYQHPRVFAAATRVHSATAWTRSPVSGL